MEKLNYPKPRVPVLPVFSFSALIGNGSTIAKSVFDNGATLKITSGTVAISLALKHAGIKEGDKVLVPAYHCTSMIEAVLAVAAVPVYYKLCADLSVDFDDVVSKIDQSIRALLVTHYFGFLQNKMQMFRDICDRHEMTLIEDCAHAYYGEQDGCLLGSYGDYSIASIKKFFPAYDGGCLVSVKHSICDIENKSAGILYNLKAFLDLYEEAAEYRRMKVLSVFFIPVMKIKSLIWNFVKSRGSSKKQQENIVESSGGYQYIDINWLNKRMSFASRLVCKLVSKSRIVEKRRNNFKRLVDALSGLQNARPLYPLLPSGVVPYMFPLLIDDPENIFPKLKMKGVPIYRWDDLMCSECEISQAYSKQLLQIPCHQELTESELMWIIENVRRTLY